MGYWEEVVYPTHTVKRSCSIIILRLNCKKHCKFIKYTYITFIGTSKPDIRQLHRCIYPLHHSISTLGCYNGVLSWSF